MNKNQYKAYKKRVAIELTGLDVCGSGLAETCETCNPDGLSQNALYELNEASFSWQSCDICGSTLGGDRVAVHAFTEKGELIHYDACIDCQDYLEDGQLNDMAMLDMADNN